jgi:hypothetical protein
LKVVSNTMVKKHCKAIKMNNLQYIYFGLRTTLASSLLFSSIIFVGSFAAYGLTVENSDIAAETEELLTEKSNIITLQKQPQLIAQTGSSEVTGDTFGDINKLRQDLLIEPIVIEKPSLRSAPGSSAGTPTAYGASGGQAYIGAGLYVPLDRGRSDGSVSVGIGAGDPIKSVAIEVSADITSIGIQDFGDSGQIGLKLHKSFEDGAAIALGWSNAIKWGDANANAKDSIYGVVTKAFELQPDANNKLPLTVSLGIGSGYFRSEGDITNNKQNIVNVFGSLGLRVIPSASVVASWTGNALNVGASITPFKIAPIVVNAVFTDMTNTFNNGIGFSLSSGYSFQF